MLHAHREVVKLGCLGQRALQIVGVPADSVHDHIEDCHGALGPGEAVPWEGRRQHCEGRMHDRAGGVIDAQPIHLRQQCMS